MAKQYPNVYYRVRDRGPAPGPRARYGFEFYAFHPEEGPKGAPGRGPYCLNRQDCAAEGYDRAVAELRERGIRPLPTDA